MMMVVIVVVYSGMHSLEWTETTDRCVLLSHDSPLSLRQFTLKNIKNHSEQFVYASKHLSYYHVQK